MAQVRERTVLEVAGTVLAAQLALKYGLATNAAGGTHHADSEMGAGYTILNDLAITANYLMKHHDRQGQGQGQGRPRRGGEGKEGGEEGEGASIQTVLVIDVSKTF